MTSEAGIPVVFVHGLWIQASSWAPWIELYRNAGYRPIAPGWPGDGETATETRAHPGRLAGVGLDEITAHYAGIIAGLDEPPIVIGHSVGGAVVQKLNGLASLRAAVVISPAPVRGVRALPLAQLRSSFPVLRNPGNTKRTVALTVEQFRYGFGNALSRSESDELYEAYAIPGPGRPIFEVATSNLRRRSPASVDTRTASRAPLLFVAAEHDHTVPAVVTRAAYRLYRDSPAVTELLELSGKAHSCVFDHGWADVAGRIEGWLERRVREAPSPQK
ncbi:alpha/beta hydrolase [Cryptosporangium phraense]|uniref:Alpha/beta fold hydrolase n=1 Tax=Cryptosporangium phraense TaxID=2593070 RepID=A0A545APT6_9ACTN|nr:alpha/beta fold hydrolase [Cryptosporangium phraense]TQS43313.1 alpha/beta fold hydrolase [Cryptosporangium phraense]